MTEGRRAILSGHQRERVEHVAEFVGAQLIERGDAGVENRERVSIEACRQQTPERGDLLERGRDGLVSTDCS